MSVSCPSKSECKHNFAFDAWRCYVVPHILTIDILPLPVVHWIILRIRQFQCTAYSLVNLTCWLIGSQVALLLCSKQDVILVAIVFILSSSSFKMVCLSFLQLLTCGHSADHFVLLGVSSPAEHNYRKRRDEKTVTLMLYPFCWRELWKLIREICQDCVHGHWSAYIFFRNIDIEIIWMNCIRKTLDGWWQ